MRLARRDAGCGLPFPGCYRGEKSTIQIGTSTGPPDKRLANSLSTLRKRCGHVERSCSTVQYFSTKNLKSVVKMATRYFDLPRTLLGIFLCTTLTIGNFKSGTVAGSTPGTKVLLSGS